jgi:hypothetical protein
MPRGSGKEVVLGVERPRSETALGRKAKGLTVLTVAGIDDERRIAVGCKVDCQKETGAWQPPSLNGPPMVEALGG